MPASTSDEKAVRLSVCPSVCLYVKRVHCEKKICLDFYTVRKIISPSFMKRKMGWWGRPILPEILYQPSPVGAKTPILNRHSLVAPQLTMIGTKEVHYALSNEPNMIVVSCPSKTQNGRFPSKTALRLKKVCYEVSLCENCDKVVGPSLI